MSHSGMVPHGAGEQEEPGDKRGVLRPPRFAEYLASKDNGDSLGTIWEKKIIGGYYDGKTAEDTVLAWFVHRNMNWATGELQGFLTKSQTVRTFAQIAGMSKHAAERVLERWVDLKIIKRYIPRPRRPGVVKIDWVGVRSLINLAIEGDAVLSVERTALSVERTALSVERTALSVEGAVYIDNPSSHSSTLPPHEDEGGGADFKHPKTGSAPGLSVERTANRASTDEMGEPFWSVAHPLLNGRTVPIVTAYAGLLGEFADKNMARTYVDRLIKEIGRNADELEAAIIIASKANRTTRGIHPTFSYVRSVLRGITPSQVTEALNSGATSGATQQMRTNALLSNLRRGGKPQ